MGELYRAACPPGQQCSDQETADAILGNPIYNYQLLKRVTVSWTALHNSLERVDRETALTRLKKVKRKLPREEDIGTAARALVHLLAVYDLKGDAVAAGKFGENSYVLCKSNRIGIIFW